MTAVARATAQAATASNSADNDISLSALLQALAVGVRSVAALGSEDYDYLHSFPEVAHAIDLAQEELTRVMQDILMKDDLTDLDEWEHAADLCDTLVEQAEAYLSQTQVAHIGTVSKTLQQKYTSAYGRLMEGLVDMTKPQLALQIPTVDTTREALFVPKITIKYHAMTPLDLTPRDGRPMDTKYSGNVEEYMDMTNVIGPLQHVPHPYRTEILALEYSDARWNPPTDRPKVHVVEDLKGTWIDAEKQLQSLVGTIAANSITTIAVDLEAHNYRSFAGMVCLMQLSFKNQQGTICDYLIDTLKLWNCLSKHLSPIFANPDICKVMHGADSDVGWLQRDFGIYVVNLWDTGRAARVLKLPSAGYAHLLDSFAGIQADKTHQLSDWRQRPLPDAMHQYAVMDTHYLLDIAEMLKYDVEHHSSPEVTMERVWEASKLVCLIRYDKELFRPNGYKSLISNNKKTQSNLTEHQELVLKELYDWRDATARECDESAQYVCSNQALLRLALSCPKNVASLQTMFHPMPPLLLQFAQDVLDIIQQAAQIMSAPRSAFFKPAERSAGILSPVLGTEALYKQAGWMTPSHIMGAATSTDDDEEDSESRKLLLVDPANKEYQSGTGTSHSLELKDVPKGDPTASTKAQMIRSTLTQQDMFGLISPANTEMENDDEDDVDSEPDDEEFEIPKSMREIYKISNRNRRNKNAPSPTNIDRVVGDTLPVDTLEGAEAALGNYFTNKRQRAKDDDQNDASLMQEIGWLESKEEMDTLLLEQVQDEPADSERGTPTSDKPFDYSTSGTLGVYHSTAPANPFFSGAAVSGPVSQVRGGRGANDKRRMSGGRGGRGGRGRQGERPEKTGGGKSHVYKQRK